MATDFALTGESGYLEGVGTERLMAEKMKACALRLKAEEYASRMKYYSYGDIVGFCKSYRKLLPQLENVRKKYEGKMEEAAPRIRRMD